MKTDITLKLEKLLEKKFNTRNDFFVFECTIGWYGKEIVDCIMYNCQREIRCFEIKQNKADFHSKAHVTFIGNTNYYVMPYALWKEVQSEIPCDIGVYVPCKTPRYEDTKTVYDVYEQLVCVRHARKRELRADKEVILSSMLRSMQRDKYKRLKELSEK